MLSTFAQSAQRMTGEWPPPPSSLFHPLILPTYVTDPFITTINAWLVRQPPHPSSPWHYSLHFISSWIVSINHYLTIFSMLFDLIIMIGHTENLAYFNPPSTSTSTSTNTNTSSSSSSSSNPYPTFLPNVPNANGYGGGAVLHGQGSKGFQLIPCRKGLCWRDF